MMRIGGLQKYSLIDYPPRISCVLFTSGCNFHCPYCHNPELSAPGPNAAALEMEQVFSFLSARRKYLDAVVISGGEPTLHPDLPGLCRDIKSMGLLLKLDTNGSRPDMIARLTEERLVDYIAMDIKTAPDRYAPLICEHIDPGVICESAEMILHAGVAHEFRTTCVKPLIDEAAVESIAGLIRGADLHAIQRPRTRNVLCPEFFRDTKRIFTEETLSRFRAVFAAAAKRAIIR